MRGSVIRRTALLLLVALGASACLGSGNTDSASPSRASTNDSAPNYVTVCPVTRPSSPVQVEGVPASFNYGDEHLRTILWAHGTLRAGRLPNGGSYATVKADGSIWAKLGWWRSTPGTLTITGQRLDAPAPPLRAEVPAGYGETGFRPTTIIFPSVGCWKVEGHLAGASLVFVVRVVKV